MQEAWFRAYLERDGDCMLMVEASGIAVGCMGFRRIGDETDVYNVILGRAEAGGRGVMGTAMRLMCSFIVSRFTSRVSAKVVQGNAALAWYRRNGFRVVAEAEGHVVVELDQTDFAPVRYEVIEGDGNGGGA